MFMFKITDIPKIPKRATDAHKGDFGRVCIIAAGRGFAGAAALAGRSALRSGSGLVRVACPQSLINALTAFEPCFTTIPLMENDDGKISSKSIDVILAAVEDNDVMAFGPGVGVSKDICEILENLIAIQGLQLVIDADGLNNLAKIRNWPQIRAANLILTPHPGEMKRLWAGLCDEPLPQDRIELAGKFASMTDSVIVLKGAGTIVSDGSNYYVNQTGNPGMATAGSGDVLTGVIVSLWGQQFGCLDSAVLGVYVHGLAGDLAAEDKTQISLIATDIIDYLANAFKITGEQTK